MKATDFFRALDDSDLDPYETRYLLRVWRRGVCWEKLANIAEATGMSIGKASQVKKSLTAKGWLIEAIADGRVACQVAIPPVEVVHDVKSTVVEVHDVKSIVVPFHVVQPEFHEVKPEFHVVSALPLIDQIEDHPINHLDAQPAAVAPSTADPELIAAREATFSLVTFWEELTKRKRPEDDAVFREKWVKPLNEIWLMCGRSLDAAKAKIQAVRDGMISSGGRIFDPSKLPAHVKALVDADALPPGQRVNGNGRANYRNDPEAREAHNREVLAQVAADFAGGYNAWIPSST